MPEPRLLLFDTASLYFRAFHGIPATLRAGDGRPVNAVRGLLDFLARFITDYSPTEVACCWDNSWRPAWRVALIPSYKAHRVAYSDVELVPEELVAQVPLIREVLAALGLPVVGRDGFEADDIMGTLADARRDPDRCRHRRPRPVPAGRRRARRCGCSTAARAWPTTTGSTPPGCGPGTTSTAPATSISPCCAATRPTVCPGWRGSGRRRLPGWSPTTAAWRASWARPRPGASPPPSRRGSQRPSTTLAPPVKWSPSGATWSSVRST